jgi:hypothetical protein
MKVRVRIQIRITKAPENLEQQKKLTNIDEGGRMWDHIKNCSNEVELTICCSQYKVMNIQEYRQGIWRADDRKPDIRSIYVHIREIKNTCTALERPL